MKKYRITELKGQALRTATKEAMKELNEAFHFNLTEAGITRETAEDYFLRFTEDGHITV